MASNFNYPVDVPIDGAVLRESKSAILVSAYGNEIWIPKSQIVPASKVQGFGDTGVLTISHWLAREKHLL